MNLNNDKILRSQRKMLGLSNYTICCRNARTLRVYAFVSVLNNIASQVTSLTALLNGFKNHAFSSIVKATCSVKYRKGVGYSNALPMQRQSIIHARTRMAKADIYEHKYKASYIDLVQTCYHRQIQLIPKIHNPDLERVND